MLLESIKSPQDLRKISVEQLSPLAREIRERIIQVVSQTGGHLASSLGAVELTLALHYCLDTPRDKIIWDVGHQAYTHKILTGRNQDFLSLRQYQGLSGFPCKDESPCDSFTSGHSSTAVSLAAGLVCARDCLKTRDYFKVVAVIGDGSLSGGLCFEGLNNAGHLNKDLVVILNTNEMSIAPNVGALSTYINKLISLPIYNRFKNSLDNFVASRIPKGSRLIKIANKFEEGLKNLFVPGMFFEELGFRYFGPLDGHNLASLVHTLKNIFSIRGAILIHVVTKKGKGYPPAENEPVKFHSASPFEIATGLPLAKPKPQKTYTEVFSQAVVDLAKENKNIVAITAAMPEGTGLDKFRDTFPERFFDVGIAESHAVCFAAGLARAGLKPVAAIYSTFLQRAYDQIVEEIAMQNLAVVFALDRAGIVGEDGQTHQGVFDVAYLRHIPRLVVMAPKGAAELQMMLKFALEINRPVTIRYPKGVCPAKELPCSTLELGRAEVLKEGKHFLLIALGSMVAAAQEAAEILEKEGLRGTLINARFIKPLDKNLFNALAEEFKFIFSVEEGVSEGGFGSAVAEAINKPVVKLALPNEFILHGKREFMLDKYGLSAEAIARTIRESI
jgi:1-deoxy-D-xylulose-5-phosphate synthase